MAEQNISSQMLKGILQGVMLMILSQQAEYGYGISKKMDALGLSQLPKGTIYPLLATMEKRGLIEGKMQPSEAGPNRKYFYVTTLGEEACQNFIQEWQSLEQVVNRVIKER